MVWLLLLVYCIGCLEVGQSSAAPSRRYLRQEERVKPSPGYHVDLVTKDVPGVRTLVWDSSANHLLGALRPGGSPNEKSGIVLVKPSGTGVNLTYLITDRKLRLNHGLAIHGGYIYASSKDNVYRWPYDNTSPEVIPAEYRGSPEVVVNNLDFRGKGFSDTASGHVTRTLLLDAEGHLYVTVGSVDNIDPNSVRAQVRRFNMSQSIPQGGHDFYMGKQVADGVRNTVGLALDLQGKLWGTDAGPDNLFRPDLNITFEENPGDEMNLFAVDDAFYGYPYCWSAYVLNSTIGGDSGPRSQWAWPSFMENYSDAWCKEPSNNKPPVFLFPAHSSPLQITFYDGQGCEGQGAFPCHYKGDAFVTLRGSWNRKLPVGYSVVHVPFNKATGLPHGNMTTIMEQVDLATRCNTRENRVNCVRPVGITFDNKGHLLVGSDQTGEIYRITTKQ